MEIFLVRTMMSSPNKIVKTEKIDGKTHKVHYFYDEETRQKIAAIRMRGKNPVYENALDFHGLRLVRGDQIPIITEGIYKADAELKAIDPNLHAEPIFIPLDLEAAKKGQLYDHIMASIKYNVYKTVFERLSKVLARNKAITHKSKEALLRLCDNLKVLNVLDDREIDTKIEQIRTEIQTEVLEPLRDNLEKEIESLDCRWRFTELE
mgnify:CR=1 FL=1